MSAPVCRLNIITKIILNFITIHFASNISTVTPLCMHRGLTILTKHAGLWIMYSLGSHMNQKPADIPILCYICLTEDEKNQSINALLLYFNSNVSTFIQVSSSGNGE